jgi:hypothetical protein
MSDNRRLPLQYVEHDLEEVQWHDGTGDSTINNQFPEMPSRDPRFVQKLDVLHQQSPGRYLRQERKLANKNTTKDTRGLQEALHHNISQTDSTIPTRKLSHSRRCTILATRPDILSSREDICFIKPQDFLALSKAIFD